MFGKLLQHWNLRMLGQAGRDDNAQAIGRLIDQYNGNDRYTGGRIAASLADRISGLLANPKLYNPNYAFAPSQAGGLPDTLLGKLLRGQMRHQVSLLLKAGFDLKQFPSHRFSHELVMAMGKKSALPVDLLDELYAAGVNPNEQRPDGRNALFAAIDAHNVEWLPLLLERGVNPFATYCPDPEKPLRQSLLAYYSESKNFRAVASDQVEDIYQLLLAQGIATFIEKKDVRGWATVLTFQDHIGNQFTYNNDIPFLMHSITNARGLGMFHAMDRIRRRVLAPLEAYLADPAAQPDYPATLSRGDLLQLHAIAEGNAVFTSAFWRDHEARFMEHYDAMPDHLRTELRELATHCSLRLMQQQHSSAQPLVFSTDVTHDGMAGHQQGKVL